MGMHLFTETVSRYGCGNVGIIFVAVAGFTVLWVRLLADARRRGEEVHIGMWAFAVIIVLLVVFGVMKIVSPDPGCGTT